MAPLTKDKIGLFKYLMGPEELRERKENEREVLSEKIMFYEPSDIPNVRNAKLFKFCFLCLQEVNKEDRFRKKQGFRYARDSSITFTKNTPIETLRDQSDVGKGPT